MKTLSDFNFKDKKVLLRTDINSDVKDGKVLMSERIREAALTIKELLLNDAKVCVIAHQGNPGKDDFVSLEQHCKFLNKFVKIKFIKDVAGEKVVEAVNSLNNGEAILLDNLRFVDDEFHPEKPDNVLVKTFSGLFDFYVNDAFSVCHRNQTSIVSFPKILKSCAGRLLEREVKALEKVSIKDCVYVLGGAKPEENVKLLTGKKVLACGLFGQLCLVATGKDLGYQNEYLKKATLIKREYGEFLIDLKNKLDNIETPLDFAVNNNGKREEIALENFPSKYRIDDIGSKTIEKYSMMVRNAKAIYMKGPAGDCSNKKFCQGTFALLQAVSECKGFTLIGGGHLSDAIAESGIDSKKFGHISLSGGALLSYVAGEKLPGLVALGI